MKFRGTGSEAEKIEPQMAPMIDVVFQLLIFFMLTLKIIEPEGGFQINMPQGKPSSEPKDTASIDPVKVTMSANQDGTLAEIQVNNEALTPIPARDPAVIRQFIEENAKEFPNYRKLSLSGDPAEKARANKMFQKAARRKGEEDVFEEVRRLVLTHVREQYQLAQDKEKVRKELKAKIIFPYELHYRYLVEATSACRGFIENGQRKDLIQNVEFHRPKAPGG